MIPVEEHLARCLACVGRLPARDIGLLDALDCLLDEDVVSPIDLPSFDNSSMDGYAVHLVDVAGAAAGSPVVLPVVADIPAGSTRSLVLPPGSTMRIMTGAPVPAGTGAVVPVEWTDAGTGTVMIRQAPADGAYVRRVGEDVRTGERVLRSGTRLSPRHVALLAAVGRASVRAVPRPRVAVLSTGSELVPPGRPLRPGQIHDSNGPGLVAAAAELGCAAHHVGIVADDAAAFTAALEDVLTRADVVVTSGGVSAGAYDTVKEVLIRLGTVRFDKVAMQPGMPQGVGTVGPDATPIFTLPGNPVSSLVSFELFVRPALRLMAGEQRLDRPVLTASAETGWTSPPRKRQFVRATLAGEGETLAVRPVGGQGSHLVADLAEATCLAVVPEDVTQVRAGDRLQCMVLERGRR